MAYNSIVAIGSSTGGPSALHKILQQIDQNLTAPIFIVQHLPRKFTQFLANRLNENIHILVKEAEHHEIVQHNTIYIAPGDYHMKIIKKNHQLKIDLSKEKHELGHRPSINVMLNSLAELEGIKKTIVILTGMGKDGAEGIKQIKKHDEQAVIIAESSETTVVNGMPAAAIATNYVTEVVRLENIASAIMKYSER